MCVYSIYKFTLNYLSIKNSILIGLYFLFPILWLCLVYKYMYKRYNYNIIIARSLNVISCEFSTGMSYVCNLSRDQCYDSIKPS